MKNKPLFYRMQFAISGIVIGLRAEKSLRFQVIVAIAVLAMLGILQPPLIWWAIIVLMIGLILFAELMNTAIEALCDFIQPEYHDQIKRIKDIAAGAVLVLSICSVLIGLMFLFEMLFNE